MNQLVRFAVIQNIRLQYTEDLIYFVSKIVKTVMDAVGKGDIGNRKISHRSAYGRQEADMEPAPLKPLKN